MSSCNGLDSFFRPRGFAIIGASSHPGTMGYQVLQNASKMGFGGGLYPVNPSVKEISGIPCHKSVCDIDAPVDLVLLLLRAELCQGAAEEIVRRHRERGDVGAVIVGSAGFSELQGEEGKERERLLIHTLCGNGIRVIGPNCVGVVDYYSGVNTTFTAPTDLKCGGVSIISQSGAFGTAYLRWGRELELVGVNKFISVGNMADVSVIELLDYLEKDDDTTAIFMYLEGTENGRELMDVLGSVSRKKPVVVLKSGRTAMGSQVAQSHTGSIAGNDAIYAGAFEQAGVIRAETVSELFNAARVFDKQPLPKGNRVCVVTVVGGPSIICVDKMYDCGEAAMAHLSDELKGELRLQLSPSATIGKPDGFIDMTASVTEEQHYTILSTLMRDPEIDGIIFLTTPPGYINEEKMCDAIIRAFRDGGANKPLLTCMLSGSDVKLSRCLLERAGLPTFEYPDDAAVVMSDLIKYAAFRRRSE